MQELRLEQQTSIAEVSFPLVFTLPKEIKESPKSYLLNWIETNRGKLDNLLRKHKAILFRNVSLLTAQDFHDAIVAFDYLTMDYVGGAAVRTQITERVFTANESPSSENIPYHHEMAQTPSPPTHLFFFCETPPGTGGETPILVSNEVYRRLKLKNPEFVTQLETFGVKYVRYLPEYDDPTSAIGRGWRSTFLTETKEGAETALKKLGSTWEWLPNGDLKTVTTPLPATRLDEGPNRAGETQFFNSIVAAYTGWNDSRNSGERAVVLHDGKDSPLHPTGIADTLEIMRELTVAVPWVAGDVLLLDNRTVMHSRRPFTGPRRILASLVRDPQR